MAFFLNLLLFILFSSFDIFFVACNDITFGRSSSTNRVCYRCSDGGINLLPNLNTFLLPSDNISCILSPIECLETEKNCVFGFVSFENRGKFRFFLTGCMSPTESNEDFHDVIQCYRASKSVRLGFEIDSATSLLANYCSCSSDLCNHDYFINFVTHYNFTPSSSKLEFDSLPLTKKQENIPSGGSSGSEFNSFVVPFFVLVLLRSG